MYFDGHVTSFLTWRENRSEQQSILKYLTDNNLIKNE